MKYTLKKNNWTNYVLPVLLGLLGLFVLLAILVPETTFMSCDKVRETLLDYHRGEVSIPLNDDQHLQYHAKYDACLQEGIVTAYQDDL